LKFFLFFGLLAVKNFLKLYYQKVSFSIYFFNNKITVMLGMFIYLFFTLFHSNSFSVLLVLKATPSFPIVFTSLN